MNSKIEAHRKEGCKGNSEVFTANPLHLQSKERFSAVPKLRGRKKLELDEKKRLARYAVKSISSKGRKYAEKNEEYRLCFQKDRDRIIHSKAFRRLNGKTQVFVEHYGDHFRTRLTHTLEVAQISRDISRTLGLNEDLAESIALAHDLGHTPFGHAGEFALDACLRPFRLHFEHNEQSKRIVEELEELYPNFSGLNLSFEVLQGLMKHKTSWDHPLVNDKSTREGFISPSLEAQVVNLADEIAYHNHDIDDGLRSRILEWKDVESLDLFHEASLKVKARYGIIKNNHVRRARVVSKMISLMVNDLCETTEKKIQMLDIQTLGDVYITKDQVVSFSQEMLRKIGSCKQFLTKKLYFHPMVFEAGEKGRNIIQALFGEYQKNPKFLPEKFQKKIRQGHRKEEIIRDYIAGMTDRFVIKRHKALTKKR